jgi:hypothetical protein
MTFILPPLRFPLSIEDERRAINRLAVDVALVRHKLNKDFGLPRLEELLLAGLREGHLALCVKAREAADKHEDPIADRALRKVAAELQTALMQKRDLAPGHLQVIAYYQGVSDRAPHKRRAGSHGEHDLWVRNIGICSLIRMACAVYGVNPTRELDGPRRSRRRPPSGISLVVAALAKNKLHLEEKTIQRHIWLGVWGELVRRIPDVVFFASLFNEIDM